jgi:hypothetical protein
LSRFQFEYIAASIFNVVLPKIRPLILSLVNNIDLRRIPASFINVAWYKGPLASKVISFLPNKRVVIVRAHRTGIPPREKGTKVNIGPACIDVF